LDRGFSQATDLAELLMQTAAIDYRSAYRIVGQTVRDLSTRGLAAADLTVEALQAAAKDVLGERLTLDDAMLTDGLDARSIVATRCATGGAAPAPMAAMLAEVAEDAAVLARHLQDHIDHIDRAESELRARAAHVASR
jgi:argininosuccinate lyase